MAVLHYSISSFDEHEELEPNYQELIKKYMMSWNDSYIKDNVFHCTSCGCELPLDKETKRAIKTAKVCPHCGAELNKIGYRLKNAWHKFEVGVKRDGIIYGYLCELCIYDYEVDFNYKLVYVRNPNSKHGFKRGVGISTAGYYNQRYRWDFYCKKWTKTRCETYYMLLTDIEKLESKLKEQPKSLKEYYNSYPFASLLKANQKYLIRKNILNHKQIDYILTFDLKSIEEVRKYNQYIKAHSIRDVSLIKRNIHTLNYLFERNIPVNDYSDYMNECKYLNITKPYPKDFYAEHTKTAKLLRELGNTIYDKEILKRYDELLKYSYSNGDFVIEPFNSSCELQTEGKMLHICISSYAKKYAEGKTSLFKVRKVNNPEVPFVALELIGERIIQQRANRNSTPSPDVLSFTKKWLETVVKTNDICYA